MAGGEDRARLRGGFWHVHCPIAGDMKAIFGQARQESPKEQATDGDRPGRTLWRSRTSLHVLAGCALIVMMRFAAPLLLPIVLSVMLFYLLDPIVDALQRWHVPRLP